MTRATVNFLQILRVKQCQTRMWTNAQRDGRPAEYRCQVAPSVQRRKIWLTPTTREWRAVTLPRCETL